ncbi:MAG TPA: AraC family transcriptional regulator [Acetobacteraceae bacterium]|nr:AraC family transcriptional regulator [Acetobacteraceae bacterium]
MRPAPDPSAPDPPGDAVAALRARGPDRVSLAFPRERYRLHAMVASAGYDNVAGRTYDWHGTRRGEAPFALLQYTIAGQGRLRFESRRFVVRPGQAMLLRFPHDNRYWLGRGERWEFFWLLLTGREVLRVWREVMAAHGPVAALPAPCAGRLAALCLSLLRQETGSPAACSATAYEAAMQLADALLSWDPPVATVTRPGGLERAVSLCHADPSARLDVAQLARAAGYSRYHFSRLFAARVGVSPARYLLQLRLDEAARLLRADPAPVKAIARRCGFEDANYFAKAFQRRHGVNPRAYRQTHPLAHSGSATGSLSPD